MRERQQCSSRTGSGPHAGLGPESKDATRGALQIGRAAVFATACVMLGLGGHLAGGGRLPSGLVLASTFMVLLATGALLARRRLGRLTGMACAGAAQLVQHLVFSASAGLASAHSRSAIDATLAIHSTSSHSTGGHSTLGHSALADTTIANTAMAHSSGSSHPLAMTLAHVLSGGALGLVLAQMDAIVWRVLEPLLRPLALMTPAPLPTTSQGCEFWRIEHPVSRLALARPPCRGPPTGIARCHRPV